MYLSDQVNTDENYLFCQKANTEILGFWYPLAKNFFGNL